ncbi:MAG TPA: VanZ family protein [Longimicrobiales bacterium]|nr:VanZ family protein [Longimicrobiales bacterium]
MLKRVAGAALALAIAWATLSPQPETGAAELVACLLCGPRAVADALLNVVMFVPVGMLLGSVLGSVPAVALAGLLSGLIETAQLAIPGRDPSLGDVLFNTIGAAAGVVAVRLGRRWLVPGAVLGTGLASLWAGLAVGAIFLTGWLLEPVLPPAPHTVQWAPALQGMAQFEGTVLNAIIGDVPLRPGPARGVGQWGERLGRGVPIAAVVTLGPPPERLAPLLTIHDAEGGEALLLGAAGDGIVYRRQVRAHRLRLDAPALRAAGILAGHAPGDTVLIAAATTPDGQCFVVQRASFCGYGHDAGDGWRLLYSGESVAPAAADALGALWLALLLLPIGFWAHWRAALALGLALGWYAWIRVPVDTVLLAIGWTGALGMLGGTVAGLLLARAARRIVSPAPSPPQE